MPWHTSCLQLFVLAGSLCLWDPGTAAEELATGAQASEVCLATLPAAVQAAAAFHSALLCCGWPMPQKPSQPLRLLEPWLA